MAKPESNGTEISAEIVNDAALEGIAGGAHEAGQSSDNEDVFSRMKKLSEFTGELTPLQLQALQGELSVLATECTEKLQDLISRHQLG